MSSYEMGRVLGITAGVVISVLLVVVFAKFFRKDGSLKCKYDERQELVQGRGFKYGFFTLLAYEFFQMICGNWLEGIVMQEVIIIFGMGISVMVYASYAILNDGYIALNENPQRVGIVFLVIAVWNIFIAIMEISEGHFFEDGLISYPATNMILGVMMLYVVVLLVVKKYVRKEGAEGQEDE